MRYFETVFLEEAHAFIATLDSKTVKKIFYVIDLAEQTNDPKLLKKLQQDIWEFRTYYAGHQIRLLAFWDKTDSSKTLVVAAQGFIKKTNRVPHKEIARAVKLRKNYFNNIH
jgi:phage-related protein